MITLFCIYKAKVYVYFAKIIEAENLTQISPELTKKILYIVPHFVNVISVKYYICFFLLIVS
jgi:hypothetical protein